MVAKLALRGVAAALALACNLAGASGLQVAPIGLEFTPASPAQGLWLTNTGDAPLHAQVRVQHWSQVNGKDELTSTQAMLASPPMLALEPGGRQLVRVIRTGGSTASGSEDAFRVLIDELPQPDRPQASSVEYVLRYSVPVFVAPAAPVDPAGIAGTLRATLEHDAQGYALRVRNDGARHAQLSDVGLIGADGAQIVLAPGLLGYVLPGMTMRWPLSLDEKALGADMQLKARVNGAALDHAIPLGTLPR
jgi:fimbrial chaperone protein